MSGIPETNDRSVTYRDAADWFRHRSYDYRLFPNLEEWSHQRRERMTQQQRQLRVVPPLRGDGRGNPAISTTASHIRAASEGEEAPRD